jgi:hypothetical protein
MRKNSFNEFFEEIRKHDPYAEQHAKQESETHQRQESAWVDKQFSDECDHERHQRCDQKQSRRERQQEQQRAKPQTRLWLCLAKLPAAALGANLSGPRIDVLPWAKADVETRSAEIAEGRFARSRPAAI